MKKALPVLIGLSLIAVGGCALSDPRKAAKYFGLATKDPGGLGFVRACGMRDVLLGLSLLQETTRRRSHIGLLAVLALSDFFTVSAMSDTPSPKALAVHFGGFIGLFGIWAFGFDS